MCGYRSVLTDEVVGIRITEVNHNLVFLLFWLVAFTIACISM